MKNVPTFFEEIKKKLKKKKKMGKVVFSQFLWFNTNIKIDNKSVFISGFASKNINFVGQIFHGKWQD